MRVDAQNEARMYERTWERLGAAGFAQYEISNFARPGHACRPQRQHLADGGVGGTRALCGFAAPGLLRGSNIADLGGLGVIASAAPTDDGRPGTLLTPALLAEDALVFGLRMNEGVDLAASGLGCPEAPWARVEALIDRLVEEDLALRDGRSGAA